MIEGAALERPTGSSHLAFGMAALAAAGGATGYAKTGSVPSLVAGLGIAALFGAGGQQINVGFVCVSTSGRQRALPLGAAYPFLPTWPCAALRAERATRHRAPCEPSSIVGACGRDGPSIHQNSQGRLLGLLLLLPHGCCALTSPSSPAVQATPTILLASPAAGVAGRHHGCRRLAEHCVSGTEESGVAGMTAAETMHFQLLVALNSRVEGNHWMLALHNPACPRRIGKAPPREKIGQVGSEGVEERQCGVVVGEKCRKSMCTGEGGQPQAPEEACQQCWRMGRP